MQNKEEIFQRKQGRFEAPAGEGTRHLEELTCLCLKHRGWRGAIKEERERKEPMH